MGQERGQEVGTGQGHHLDVDVDGSNTSGHLIN